MAYDKSDPRAALVTAVQPKPKTGLIAEAQLATFYDTAPNIRDKNGASWFLRGHNFILVQSEAEPGGTFERNNQPDEHVVLLPSAGAVISVNGRSQNVAGNSIAFIPPGDSCVTIPEGGRFVRLFTSQSLDLVALCPNAKAYDIPRDHIPSFQAWPVPLDGWKLRHYSLDVMKEEGRFGRIFRCTTFMVNILDPYEGPRNSSKLSPHHHDDFEQGSLVLEGSYSHHLRWPWTTDMADWRDDIEFKVGAPSALVIPPPVVHTSRATGSGHNAMVDIFCPPRMDFSLKPGWVLNADDYPMAKVES